MSILALQKQRDPQAGYATDFLDVLERLGPYLQGQPALKIITNAGGMNPAACAARRAAILDKAGLADRTHRHRQRRRPAAAPRRPLGEGHAVRQPRHRRAAVSVVRPRVVSANAYLGSRPIAEALQQGASVVITGRVADASLTLAPAVHEFGWAWDDWDRLAAGTVAGHLIECGAQATGGLWCNWHGGRRPGRRRLSHRRDRRRTARSASPSRRARAAPSTARRWPSNCSTRSATRRRI